VSQSSLAPPTASRRGYRRRPEPHPHPGLALVLHFHSEDSLVQQLSDMIAGFAEWILLE